MIFYLTSIKFKHYFVRLCMHNTSGILERYFLRKIKISSMYIFSLLGPLEKKKILHKTNFEFWIFRRNYFYFITYYCNAISYISWKKFVTCQKSLNIEFDFKTVHNCITDFISLFKEGLKRMSEEYKMLFEESAKP